MLTAMLILVSLFSGMTFAPITAYAATTVEKANVICAQYSYMDAGCDFNSQPTEIIDITLSDAQAFGNAVSCPTTYWVIVYAKDGDNIKWTSNGKTGEQTSTPPSSSISAYYNLYAGDVFSFSVDPMKEVTFFISKGLKVVTSSVTLNTNGGTINSGNIATYDEGTGATLPTDVTRDGYTFVGWYDNEYCTGTAVTEISTTDTGAKTFYAKWTEDTSSSTNLVGTVVKFFEVIDLTGKYYLKSDTSNEVEYSYSSFRLAYIDFYETYRQWNNQWKFENTSGSISFCISGPSSPKPDGFVVSGGDGTETNPYTFSLHYPEAIPSGSYIITIPATLTVSKEGWNELPDGITAKGDIEEGKSLKLTAESENGWKLVSASNDEINYTLLATSTDSVATTSWEFTSAQLSGDGVKINAGINVASYSNMPAGNYSDTVTFTASMETAVPKYAQKLKESNGNGEYSDVVQMVNDLKAGNISYNSSLTAQEAWEVAKYQANKNGDGKKVYVIMSVEDNRIHYVLSTDTSASEKDVGGLYEIIDSTAPVDYHMYYVEA